MLWSFLRIAQSGLSNHKNTWRLLRELDQTLSSKGLSMSDQQRKRLVSYTWQSAMTNLWFSTLRGERPTSEEIDLGLWVGAITPFLDDLMDDNNWTFDQVLQEPTTDSTASLVFHHLWEKLAPYFTSNTAFEKYFNLAIPAQDRSLVQVQEEKLTREQLAQINADKGGYFTLWFRTILQNALKEGEEEAIYTLGATLQLLNDIYDLHKDVTSGTQSMVNVYPDMREVAPLYDELWTRFKEQYRSLPYSQRQIERSLRTVAGVTATGYVALHRFKQIQGDSDRIDVPSFERKELIVDMEKASNLWLNWKLAGRISR